MNPPASLPPSASLPNSISLISCEEVREKREERRDSMDRCYKKKKKIQTPAKSISFLKIIILINSFLIPTNHLF